MAGIFRESTSAPLGEAPSQEGHALPGCGAFRAGETSLRGSPPSACFWAVGPDEAAPRPYRTWMENQEAEPTPRVYVTSAWLGPSWPLDSRFADRYGLTPREAEVAVLLASRCTTKEIAATLGISAHTVKRHTEKVFGKLAVNRRRDVAKCLTEPWGQA